MAATTIDHDALNASLADIEAAREAYEKGAKHLKLTYLTQVKEAQKAHGTQVLADGIGVTRHRIYQILKEQAVLAEELNA